MNIQLDSPNKRSSTSILHRLKTKIVRLLKAIYEFVTSEEPDKEKRRNELDYFDYIQLEAPQNKVK